MTEIGYQLGLLFSHNPVLKWLVVLAGFLLLLLSLYKLTIAHTVTKNGRVDTQFKIPTVSVRKPELKLELKHKTYTKSERRVFSVLYKLQLLVFGILLFFFGLGLITLAVSWLIGTNQSPGGAWSVLAVLSGSVLMVFGFLAVFYRNRGNPFEEA